MYRGTDCSMRLARDCRAGQVVLRRLVDVKGAAVELALTNSWVFGLQVCGQEVESDAKARIVDRRRSRDARARRTISICPAARARAKYWHDSRRRMDWRGAAPRSRPHERIGARGDDRAI